MSTKINDSKQQVSTLSVKERTCNKQSPQYSSAAD